MEFYKVQSAKIQYKMTGRDEDQSIYSNQEDDRARTELILKGFISKGYDVIR